MGHRELIWGEGSEPHQAGAEARGALMPGWDVQGSALVLDLSWAQSGVQSCSCDTQISVQEPNFS